ncbi:MAG: hypothetical protein BHW56_06760 [Acetobacter sp. 46_36]|jgi:hypothetical protein|nr:MAG: hypothetical protein BHW56_06760 [Acetobacter sp. 46_36]
MRGLANECGSRNSFGYYDASAKEIILKRPCLKKQDLEEAYLWLDNSLELRKFSIGIGSVEVFVADGNIGGLYTTARGMLKNSMMKNKYSDAEMLRNMLLRLKKKEKLRNLAVKCFIFNDDPVLFELLLDTIRGLGSLVYLDLTGCYFSDEQLADLADVISKTKIAHLVWPEPRMDKMVLGKVMRILEINRSLVVLSGVPMEMQKLAKNNRENLFALGKRPSMMSEEEEMIIREYGNSIQLAIAYEKEKLYNLEQTFMAILAEPKCSRKSPSDDPEN